MADGEWMQSIKAGRKLTYFNGANVGKWAGIIDLAAKAFNDMPDSIVTYTRSKQKDSANVVIGVSNGNATFPYGGNSAPIVLQKHQVHGRTRTFDLGSGIEKAAIFLPSAPSASHKNYLIFIAAHELLHATGLEGHENDGLLLSPPNMFDGKVFSTPDTQKMPPLFLGAAAAARMAAKW
jgi:hypothetical protein